MARRVRGYVVRLLMVSVLSFVPAAGAGQDPLRSGREAARGPQILGGTQAQAGDYPWQVALIREWEDNPYDGLACGGSLITPEWVLTAAHCVIIAGFPVSPESRQVILGVLKLSDAPRTGSQGQRLNVDRIIPHPGFEYASLQNDIALLHLSTPAELGPMVGTIVPASNANEVLFSPSVNATVIGWGSQGETRPDELYRLSLPIVIRRDCEAAMGPVFPSNLCAGSGEAGQDACTGDSGGPLVVPDGSGGWLLAGIVSWGYSPCGQSGRFSVYTRVASYKSWIHQYIGPFFYLPFVAR